MEIEPDMTRKKELILAQEKIFANQISRAVFEKPKVNYWMILLPLLFIYFVYRMQKYKNGRLKFDEDFMITRRRAIDVAVEALTQGVQPDVDLVVQQSTLDGPLVKAYESWVRVLVEYYMDLLSADGASFASLARSAYGSATNYLLFVNRLGMAERSFYGALRERLESMEGAASIISTIEQRSQELRRNLAQEIFA